MSFCHFPASHAIRERASHTGQPHMARHAQKQASSDYHVVPATDGGFVDRRPETFRVAKSAFSKSPGSVLFNKLRLHTGKGKPASETSHLAKRISTVRKPKARNMAVNWTRALASARRRFAGVRLRRSTSALARPYKSRRAAFDHFPLS